MLLHLSDSIARNPVPGDLREKHRINSDISRAGHYRYPGRIDTRQFALERFQNLREVAAKLSLPDLPDSLEEADFVPGTIGKHLSPGSYDFSSWVDGESIGGDL